MTGYDVIVFEVESQLAGKSAPGSSNEVTGIGGS
jgi:hypothetical protein